MTNDLIDDKLLGALVKLSTSFRISDLGVFFSTPKSKKNNFYYEPSYVMTPADRIAYNRGGRVEIS